MGNFYLTPSRKASSNLRGKHVGAPWTDKTRIDQFPEWFTTDATARYAIRHLPDTATRTGSGADRQHSLDVDSKNGEEIRWILC